MDLAFNSVPSPIVAQVRFFLSLIKVTYNRLFFFGHNSFKFGNSSNETTISLSGNPIDTNTPKSFLT